jgi:hypothetical protein
MLDAEDRKPKVGQFIPTLFAHGLDGYKKVHICDISLAEIGNAVLTRPFILSLTGR